MTVFILIGILDKTLVNFYTFAIRFTNKNITSLVFFTVQESFKEFFTRHIFIKIVKQRYKELYTSIILL